MSARAGKRPMRSLTAHEKLDAIRRVHDGESKASVARDIGVPESTLRGWCKNEDKISYLSRQSSPDTDESLEPQTKKSRLEDPTMQPFNLSVKSTNSGTFSPNSENRYVAADCTKNEADPSKAPLNLKTTTKNDNIKTPTDHYGTEKERNRAELARMKVELGLNRPEMYISNLQPNPSLADLTVNIGFLTHWNNLLMQQQQQQQQKVSPNKNKMSAPADSTHVGLLTTVDQEQKRQLPKEQQSVNESIWHWLKNQQSKMGFPQNTVTNMPLTNGASTSTTTPATIQSPVSTSMALNGLNGIAADQRSWFWKWYQQIAHSHLEQQQFQTAEKQILYQQLTKEAPQRDLACPDQQQNVENLSVNGEQSPTNKINSNKARSVLDNLLLSNNNNVDVNKREGKDDEDTLDHAEALGHGEKFLKYLESCSDPSVTAVQIMQFKTLLNNVRAGVDRRNGEKQNKAKGKRK